MMSLVVAALLLAPTAPPPDDQLAAIEPLAVETFTAELAVEGIEFLVPVCGFWTMDQENPQITIWRCYAMIGSPGDEFSDVATGIVTHDAATGETAAIPALAFAESGMLSLYCAATSELSILCP